MSSGSPEQEYEELANEDVSQFDVAMKLHDDEFIAGSNGNRTYDTET
jgi:hypothetical protein